MSMKDFIAKMMQTPGSMAAKANDKNTSTATKKKVKQFKEAFTGSKPKKKTKKAY